MKFLVFKILLKITCWFTPNKEVIHSFKQRLYCLEREQEMQACIRPKTYPKIPKGSTPPHYTDYYDQ